MAAFQYAPLQNPAGQIRLLLYQATRTRMLRFELSVWAIDEAPAYNAISYSWGNPADNETVMVEEVPMRVRRNCHEALTQAIKYNQKKHIWVDSICINQSDDYEKGYQVRMMYNIYENASEVLACVGSHKDGSEHLAELCHADASTLRDSLGALCNEDCTSLSGHQDCTDRGPDFDIALEAVLAFSHRPYWERLWIIQEFIAGASGLQILCGGDSIPLAKWDVIETYFWDENDLLFTPLLNVYFIRNACQEGKKCPLSTICYFLGNAMCADDRDRIYGLLAIIDWGSQTVKPIVPDYTRSVWDVAVHLVRQVGPYDCVEAMSLLRIDSRTPEMRSLLEERSLPEIHWRDSVPVEYDWQQITCFWIHAQSHGALHIGPLGDDHEHFEDEVFAEALNILNSTEKCTQLGINTRLPQPVIHGGEILGLVSSNTSPGDVLVFMSGLDEGKRCLILRATPDSRHDVVGTGYLHNYLVEADIKPNDGMFTAEMRLIASPEDLMSIFCRHDAKRTASGSLEPVDYLHDAAEIAPAATAELLRLTRRALHRPEGAAKLTYSEDTTDELDDAMDSTEESDGEDAETSEEVEDPMDLDHESQSDEVED